MLYIGEYYTALLLTYGVGFIQDLVAQNALENILKRHYAYHRIPGIQLHTHTWMYNKYIEYKVKNVLRYQ